jgi:hypothetical protein
MKTPEVITQKCSWRVCPAALDERELVNGNSIPPAFTFPLIHHKYHFITGALGESVGLSCNSSWMAGQPICSSVEAYKTYCCNFKRKSLPLALDNHNSHVTTNELLFHTPHMPSITAFDVS